MVHQTELIAGTYVTPLVHFWVDEGFKNECLAFRCFIIETPHINFGFFAVQ